MKKESVASRNWLILRLWTTETFRVCWIIFGSPYFETRNWLRKFYILYIFLFQKLKLFELEIDLQKANYFSLGLTKTRWVLSWSTVLDYASTFLETRGEIHMISSRQQGLTPKLVSLDFFSRQWRQVQF